VPNQTAQSRVTRLPTFFDNRSTKSNQLDDPFLSPKEAAKYLGVSVRLIYERMARGEIEVQPVGRLRRIRLSNLEAWLHRQKDGR